MEENDALRAMDAEQLREHAHKIVDFIADYYKTIQNFPVLSQVQVLHSSPSLPINAFTYMLLDYTISPISARLSGEAFTRFCSRVS